MRSIFIAYNETAILFVHVRGTVKFQKYIPGTDYRVHVIKHKAFACEIHTDAIDYRYADKEGMHVIVLPTQLPEDIIERCCRLTAGLGLTFSGIDLRCAPDGTWYCFEVNPSPGFTYFQSLSGQQIAQALVELLRATL